MPNLDLGALNYRSALIGDAPADAAIAYGLLPRNISGHEQRRQQCGAHGTPFHEVLPMIPCEKTTKSRVVIVGWWEDRACVPAFSRFRMTEQVASEPARRPKEPEKTAKLIGPLPRFVHR